jgi:hypothetical protein
LHCSHNIVIANLQVVFALKLHGVSQGMLQEFCPRLSPTENNILIVALCSYVLNSCIIYNAVSAIQGFEHA